ncbi:putative Cna B domain protein [Acidobacteriia bacterium SbA2]|nr:putative Cna B domain protein [Acidobacteriia bacterium SbA2]
MWSSKSFTLRATLLCLESCAGSFVWLLCFLALASTVAFAQVSRLTGQVTDESGAAVPGADVVLTNMGTHIARTAVTSNAGNYELVELPPGVYEATVTKTGFEVARQSNITIIVNQTARLDFALKVGSVTQEVTVTAAAPLLKSENATVGQLVDARQVTDLPLNGRNFVQLAALTPGGLVQTGGLGALSNNSLSVNGMRQSANSFEVEGTNTYDQNFDGTTILPAPDAVQEVKVQTNVLDTTSAWSASLVTVVLKSGTNQLHGSGYEFLRNDKLDSRDFFANSVSPFKQNQFGATIGGPIKKDRAFFFGDYQGTRVRGGTTGNPVVPSAALRNGDFSGLAPIIDPATGVAFPNNQIPSASFSGPAVYFLQFMPLPNTPAGTYSWAPNDTNHANQFDVKVDYQLRPADTLTTSYSYYDINPYTPGSYPDQGGEYDHARDQRANLGWVHNFSPTIINEARISYNRSYYTGYPQGAGTNYTVKSGIPGFDQTSAVFPGFPGISISGYAGLNGNFWRPIVTPQNRYMLNDNFTWLKGAHTIRIGGSAMKYGTSSSNAAWSRGRFNFTGDYTGNAFADYLLGVPYSAGRDFPRNLWSSAEDEQMLYISDTWKVTPHVSLTFGTQYNLQHPTWSPQNTMASYDPYSNVLTVDGDAQGHIDMTAQQITQFVYPLFANLIKTTAQQGLPNSLYILHKDVFSPRLGVAWSPRGSWVVRAGYGLSHVLEQGNRIISDSIIDPPFIADASDVYNTPTNFHTLGNYFGPIGVGTWTLADLGTIQFFDIDPHRAPPYYQDWNFTVQKLVHNAISFEAGYVATKGTHLSFANTLNTPTPGPGSIQSRRLRTTIWGTGWSEQNIDDSTFHSLQLKAETKSWHGLNLLANYMWSKTIDGEAGGAIAGDYQGYTVEDPLHPELERGVVGIPQRLTASAVYAFPGYKGTTAAARGILNGWSLSSILTVQSGQPFTPSLGSDPANTGTSVRPNRIGSGMLSNPTPADEFDVSAFTVPTLYTYGNAGNNILRSLRTSTWDAGLLRDFKLSKLREGAYLQFRAEFFNFRNTPIFGSPVSDIQAPNAGQILYSAGAPREIQFALKLEF